MNSYKEIKKKVYYSINLSLYKNLKQSMNILNERLHLHFYMHILSQSWHIQTFCPIKLSGFI